MEDDANENGEVDAIYEVKEMKAYKETIGTMTKYTSGKIIANVLEGKLTRDIKRRMDQIEFVQDPEDAHVFVYTPNQEGASNG